MTMQPDNPLAPGGDLRAGVLLHNGRYRVRSKLGQGGMGLVYLAEDTLLPGRLVAVKENADASAEAQSQFKREALLLARLRHPNLPQVTDYFVVADGRQHLVMDYVPGDNLTELMRKRQGALPAAEALSIIEQVMQALAYMHTWRDPDSGRTRPIIHRDIKPANIKRTPEGRVVLVDFGIAKVDSNTMTGTAVSAKALTPGYAPLEQYGGGTDARSDIYALGATLYALLTGKAPPSATDMAMAGSKQQAPLLNNLKSAPPAIVKVVERAMQTLPKDRYQSIAEMHQALYNRPLAASGAGQMPISGSAGARRWWPALLLGVLALLAAAGVGWLLFAQSSDLPGAPVAVLPTSATIMLTALPMTTPATRATFQQSAHGAGHVTAMLTEAPSAMANPTPVPSATATLRSTATSTLHPTMTPTYTPHPTVGVTVTAVELEVQRRLAATQTVLVLTKTTPATQTPRPTTRTPTPRPTATVDATAIEQEIERRLVIEVQAKHGWQDTGIKLRQGASVAIFYVSGEWSACAAFGCPFVGPGGWTSAERWKTPEESRNYGDNIIQGCPHAALVARFSNSSPFCLEHEMVVQAPTQGLLEFRINDQQVNDNGGTLRMQLEIR